MLKHAASLRRASAALAAASGTASAQFEILVGTKCIASWATVDPDAMSGTSPAEALNLGAISRPGVFCVWKMATSA
jgi:hypothetical protein